jgi:hypothetical protein
MKTRNTFKNAATLPVIAGDLLVRNHYDAEMYIPLSSIRNLQSECKNAEAKFKAPCSFIVMKKAESYQIEYAVHCDIAVLHQAVKLAKWGYDVDLRPYSGKMAERLDTIAPILQQLPEKERAPILTAFAKKPLGFRP